MTITMSVEFGKREIHTFDELVGVAYELAMEFGRGLVSRTLEARDEELMEGRDKKRFRSKGKQQTSRMGDSVPDERHANEVQNTTHTSPYNLEGNHWHIGNWAADGKV